MKIIVVDKLDRHKVSDLLVAGNVTSIFAGLIVTLLNKEHEGGEKHYEAVSDDYELYKFKPNTDGCPI